MENSSPAEFDPELAEIIWHKVRRLIGHYGLTCSDEQELQQQLYMQVFEAMGQYNPRRGGRNTFADRIVTSKIATIIEGRTAKMRDWRKQRPLDDAHHASFNDAGQACEYLDLGIDVRDTLAHLPAELQRWAVWFMEMSEPEIIRQKGQTRGKVREMRRRLAEHIRVLGLDPNFPD